jgi:hypothetical protein
MANATTVLTAGFLMMVALGTASPSSADEVSIPVRLADRSGLPLSVQQGAEERVTAIFKAAGIEIVWIDQSSGGAADITGPPPLTVIIPTRKAVTKMYAHPDAMGFTPISNPPGNVTYIVAFRVEEEARSFVQDTEIVLAAAIAHELGHLLMPGRPHTIAGVMRAALGRQEILLAAQGALAFLPVQAQLMRTTILGRTRNLVAAKE